MRSVTSRFTAAAQDSYMVATSAVVLGPDGAETSISIADGNVTQDQTAAVRGRCDVTLVDDGSLGLVPTSPADLLAPYGNEVRLARGVTYPDGATELVNLGVFGFQDIQVDDTDGGLQIQISGLDRAQRFVDARFEEPYDQPAGVNYATAILTALQAVWPDFEYNFTATALTTPSLIAQEQDDRWQFVQDMAKAISMRLYFDGDGILRLVPDILTDPVATIAEGDAGVLITASRRWTREGAYNAVIATGENTGEDAPSRGVAIDDNPLSPTYYYGRFGRVPRFYSSPFITTDDQAAAAALSVLNGQLGTSQQVNFGSLVLPHLEPGDTVQVTRLLAGINEANVLDSVTIPLGPEATMGAQTRARQVV